MAEANTHLDIDHLRRYVGDDLGLQTEILDIYDEQLNHWLGVVKSELDDEAWYQVMHTLKGASRGVGAWAIGDLCQKGEGFSGDQQECERARTDLIQELQVLASAVLDEIKDLRTAAAA